MENNIIQMAAIVTLTNQSSSHEIFHDQISNWLQFTLDNNKYFKFEVFNIWLAVEVDLKFYVVPKAELTIFR